MNKRGLLIAAFFIFLCSQAGAQKIKMKKFQDSLQYIVDTYNEYVRDLKSRRPNIVILELPQSFPGHKNDYFNETDARNLCKTDPSLLSKFEKTLGDAKAKVKKRLEDAADLASYDLRPSIQRPYSGSIYDYKFYFIDPTICPKEGKDLFAIVGCPQGFEDRVRREIFGVGTSIEDLLFSKSYIDDAKKSVTFSRVPAFLEYLLKQSLRISLAALSPGELKQLKKARIYYKNPRGNQTMLWVSSNKDSIFIAPYLIRAAFFYSLNSVGYISALLDEYNDFAFKYNSPQFGYDPLSEFIRFHRPEVEGLVRRFFFGFSESFSFSISHELAHTYNDDKWNVLSEIRCDCNAISHLKIGNPQLKLGVFTTLLQESIKKGIVEVWGIENVRDLQTRFQYIEKFLKGFTECDKVSLNNLEFATVNTEY